MKKIEVVAAIIKDKDKIFATQRADGEFKNGWEFPGGKIELGESPEVALMREIKEELNTEIEVGNHVCTVEYDYSTFHLTMHCYWCQVVSGKLELLEHKAAKWLGINNLDSVEWLPADVEVVDEIKRTIITEGW